MKENLMKKLLLTTLILGSFLLAQEALTLEAAINTALENNYGIKMVRNSTRMSENSASLGNAGLLPTIDASSATYYQDFDGVQNGVPVDAASTTNSAGLSLSYTIFNGLNGLNTYQLLQEQSNGAQLQERLTIENTLLGVAQAFFNQAAAKENLTITAELLRVSRERLALTEERVALGSEGRLEHLSARVDFNVDSIAFLDAEYNYNNARRELNVLLGWKPDKQYEVLQNLDDFPAFELDQLQEQARNNNSAYLLSENSITTAALNLKSSKGSFLPRISYTASYGFDQSAADLAYEMDDPNKTLSHMISFNWNLFGGGSRKTAVQNARLSLDNAELQKEEQLLSLRKDVDSYYSAYLNSLAVLESDKNSLEFAELNFERSAELYRLGQISSLQYREAQLALSQTRQRITQSRYSARIYELMILQLSGQLL